MSSSSKSNFFSISSVALRAGDKIHGEQMEEAFYSLASLPEDVFIVTGDNGSIQVSRTLLSIFSPTLRKMFASIPCCVSPTIFLPDCSTTSVRHLLSLITTGVTSNDKIVPKEVLAAAEVLSIKLKNIIRGTLNNNGKTPIPSNNRSAKRKPSEAGDNQNSKKLHLKFNFQNSKEKSNDEARNPVSPQLQPAAIAIQLQTVFPQLQQTLGFESPSIVNSAASFQSPSIVNLAASLQSPSINNAATLQSPSIVNSTPIPPMSSHAPPSKVSSLFSSQNKQLQANNSNNQNSRLTNNKISEVSGKIFAPFETAEAKKPGGQTIPEMADGKNVKIDKITRKKQNRQPPVTDAVKSEPFSCQLCDKNYFRSVDDLWQHYCASHFQEELRAEFGSYLKGKTCVSCNEKFATRPEAAKHIGIKHEKVNLILRKRGLEELPLPLTPKIQFASEGYYLVDIEKDKITLEAKEPKNSTIVDLETNKTINNNEVATKFSNEQEEVLKEAYLEDEKLSAERRNTLSIALGLKEDDVEDWFMKKNGTQPVEHEENSAGSELPSSKEEFLTLEFEADSQLTETRKVGLAIALGLTENQVSQFFKSKIVCKQNISQKPTTNTDDLSKFVGKNIEDILNETNHVKKTAISDTDNTKEKTTKNSENNEESLSINWLNNFLQQKIDKAKEAPAVKMSTETNKIDNTVSEHLKTDESIDKDRNQKKFTKFSVETVKNLKREFSLDKGMLPTERRKFIASKLGLTEDQVRHWYKRERSRLKVDLTTGTLKKEIE